MNDGTPGGEHICNGGKALAKHASHKDNQEIHTRPLALAQIYCTAPVVKQNSLYFKPCLPDRVSVKQLP